VARVTKLDGALIKRELLRCQFSDMYAFLYKAANRDRPPRALMRASNFRQNTLTYGSRSQRRHY